MNGMTRRAGALAGVAALVGIVALISTAGERRRPAPSAGPIAGACVVFYVGDQALTFSQILALKAFLHPPPSDERLRRLARERARSVVASGGTLDGLAPGELLVAGVPATAEVSSQADFARVRPGPCQDRPIELGHAPWSNEG